MFQIHYRPHHPLTLHLPHPIHHYRQCTPPIPAPSSSLNHPKNTFLSIMLDKMAKLLHRLTLRIVLQVQIPNNIRLLVLLVSHQ